MERMRELLQTALAPVHLNIEDESHLHRGHAGAKDGRGHFAVVITASIFEGKAPLARHRLVYGALGDMMQTDIHALRLDTQVPKQARA